MHVHEAECNAHDSESIESLDKSAGAIDSDLVRLPLKYAKLDPCRYGRRIASARDIDLENIEY